MTEACKERTLESLAIGHQVRQRQVDSSVELEKFPQPAPFPSGPITYLHRSVGRQRYSRNSSRKRPPYLHQVQKMSRSSRSLPRPAQDIPRSSPQAYPRFAHNVTHCGNHYHICSTLFRGFKRLWVYGKHFAAGGLMAYLASACCCCHTSTMGWRWLEACTTMLGICDAAFEQGNGTCARNV